MSEEDMNIEPSTNLSLALGYSNRCIQRILNNDPGAGANAASTVDMTFVDNPLSELVWSPHKGLSLKCADGSFTNKKPSLSWGVGPTNMASRSSSDKPVSSTEKPIDNEIRIASLEACNLSSDVAGGDNSTKFHTVNASVMPLTGMSLELNTATGDQVDKMENAENLHFLEEENLRHNKAVDELELDMAHNYPSCEENIVRATDVSDENLTFGTEIVLASEFHTLKECEAYNSKIQNATTSRKGHEESSSVRGKNGKNKIVTSLPGIFPLEKLEATAENDLETPLGENVCGVTTKILASEFADRVEKNTQQDNDLLPTDKAVAVEQSPTNNRMQNNQTKGKCKALSYGDENGRTLNEEDGSHESVESCNSARLFSTQKRQWNFEQQLIVGRKRIKKQIEESPGSSSLVKPDSSFVNWISNMMKGFLKSSQGEAPFLSPALANPSHGHVNPDQDIFTSNKKKDPACRTIGFQSIFQSLYSQRKTDQEAVTLNANHQPEGSKECESDDKACDLNATPITCRMVTGNIYKRLLPSNERFKECTSGNQAVMAVQSRDIPISFPIVQENSKSNSIENKSSCNLETGKQNHGTSSNSSQGKHKRNIVGKIDSEMPSEEKTAHNFCHKDDPLESLWIARFIPKTSGPSLNQYPSNKGTGEALDCTADGTKLKPELQNPLGSSSEHENVDLRKQSTEEPMSVQNRGIANEASFGFYKVKGHRDDRSMHKPNSVIPYARVKTSEGMASVFARRLDALKHIIPTDDSHCAARATITCFFCGMKGHSLRECPDVTNTELEDLLRNINSYDGIKEFPCVCIRCFQQNHWAVSCASKHSGVKDRAECKASLVNQCGLSTLQLNIRNEDDMTLEQISARDSGMERGLINNKLNEAATYGKMNLNVKLIEKEIASCSELKGLKGNQMPPLNGFISGLISNIPKGIFDTVRSLRLTRTNILKWMNSNLPLSHLNGYFVRLRLGKWEEGLGGTGYYVARITGAQMESSSKKSKKSVAVNVGGIKCVVESQYVSNHDFHEDELRAWWSDTTRGDDQLPTEEELRSKVKEKKTLGLEEN